MSYRTYRCAGGRGHRVATVAAGWLAAAVVALVPMACRSNSASPPGGRQVAPADEQASARPDPGVGKILFTLRRTYVSDHFYTDFINGCSPEHFSTRNGIYTLDIASGQVEPLITSERLPGGRGLFGRFSLSPDATEIVFDYRASLAEGFRIWRVNTDGTGLEQLTFPPADEAERSERYSLQGFEEFEEEEFEDEDFEDHEEWEGEEEDEEAEDEEEWGEDDAEIGEPEYRYDHHTDDMHPAFAADGSILFTSTRPGYIVLCDYEGFLTSAVLHRIDADGGGLEQLTRSPVSEFSPTPMPDGRILYTRWEYIDKGSVCVKGLWSMNPDGTGSQEVFGNNHATPPTITHGRVVPGAEELVVAVGCPHFPQGGSLGTLMLIDTTRDIRTDEPVTYLTPRTRLVEEAGWEFDGRSNGAGIGGRLYTDPFPLSEELFLASCKHDEQAVWNDPAAYDLYLLDRDGNHWCLYDDAESSCWQPTPLAARAAGTLREPVRDPGLAEADQALVIVTNIYEGLEGVEPGTIRWIRINEAVPRFWASQRWQYGRPLWEPFITSTGWHGALWVRVQWGIVPVEEDGSACFHVPADRNIFFQALDEQYMEVQRERTYVNYRPGEIRSCVGCHERTGVTGRQPEGLVPLALTRPPGEPGPQPGESTGQRVIHYESDVQPIFDARCASCHAGDAPAGGLILTGSTSPERREEGSEYYVDSYLELIEGMHEYEQPRQYLGPLIGEGVQEMAWAAYEPPYSLGSHRSRLIDVLRHDPDHNTLLTEAELIRLITWVDSNAQYYGSYYGRHHSEHRGHPNFRRVPTFEEAVGSTAPDWHR